MRQHSEEVFALSKRRLKFSKLGWGKYISHLDLLRAFTRAVHRAKLPVRYSQGFNPHQLITFSLPLPIGVTSETEFVDIDFEDTASNTEIIEALNKNLPPDIRILAASVPECRANDISAARYVVDITAEAEVSERAVNDFFGQNNIPAVKKTKKGEKEVNLKEFIREYEITAADKNRVSMCWLLSAGGSANIKPEIVVSKLEEFLGLGEFESVDIHRTEIYYLKDGKDELFC